MSIFTLLFCIGLRHQHSIPFVNRVHMNVVPRSTKNTNGETEN